MSQPELFPYPKNRLQEIDAALASSLQDLLEKEVVSRRLELKEDYERLLAPAMKKILVDIGLQKMFWPESLGGEGHNEPRSSYTVASSLEQVGRADIGLSFLAAHSLALQAALQLDGGGNDELAGSLAPLFCGSDRPVIVSFVFPSFGEVDDRRPQWRGKYFQVEAESADGVWVLNGKGVRPTCSGRDADLFGMWCSVKGEDEPAFVVVPGDSDGLSRGPELVKTGLAASRNAEIELSGVTVPEANCAWRDEKGLRRLLSWYHLGLAATAAGGLLASYGIIKEWGDNRVIKGRGQVFKENPLAAALMAEAAQETAVDRLLAYNLAEMLAEPSTYGDPCSNSVYTSASIIANYVYRSADNCVHHIMELMASAGYATEWQLERYWRDIKTVQCYLGNYELSKMDVARYFYGCRNL